MEHPDITFARSYGYPHIVEDNPTCPECGEETYTVYIDEQGDIIGCPECVWKTWIDEYYECPYCGAGLEENDFVYRTEKQNIRMKAAGYDSIIGCCHCIKEAEA